MDNNQGQKKPSEDERIQAKPSAAVRRPKPVPPEGGDTVSFDQAAFAEKFGELRFTRSDGTPG